MGDTVELPSNMIDLDKYRKQRVDEGTWPPDEKTVVEYWKGRRNKGKKPEYNKINPPGGAA